MPVENANPVRTGNEQYCHAGFTATYNSPVDDPGGFTYGGYSQRIVADESFRPENACKS